MNECTAARNTWRRPKLELKAGFKEMIMFPVNDVFSQFKLNDSKCDNQSSNILK